MKICKHKHSPIVHELSTCPLCNLRQHNDEVHDFIEKLKLQYELVHYQKMDHELSKIAESVKDHIKSCYVT